MNSSLTILMNSSVMHKMITNTNLSQELEHLLKISRVIITTLNSIQINPIGIIDMVAELNTNLFGNYLDVEGLSVTNIMLIVFTIDKI